MPIIEQIGSRLDDIASDPRLHALERRPTAVDGTLLHALPKMLWALWLNEDHRAAKLHRQLDLLRGRPLRLVRIQVPGSPPRAPERHHRVAAD